MKCYLNNKELYASKIISNLAPWVPSDISSDLLLWLDAHDTDTIVLNGNNVSQWNDKSGNGRNVIQDIAVNQPTFISNGLNNLPTISNGNSINSKGLRYSNTIQTFSPKHILAVGKYTGPNPFQSIGGLVTFNYLGAIDLPLFHGSSGTTWIVGGGNTIFTNGNTTHSATALPTISSPFLVRTGPIFPNTDRSQIIIGSDRLVANRGWIGDFSEVIVLNKEIDINTLQKLEGYLAHKWSLAVNLPSDHPYKNVMPLNQSSKTIFSIKSKIPWTPKETNQNLELWLDANDSNTIILNGSSVSQWSDKSENNILTTQSIGAKQPLFTENGINNLPSINWNVAGQTLNLSTEIPITEDMMIISLFERAASGINTIDIASNLINNTPFGTWWGTTNFINGGLGTGQAVNFGNITSSGYFISSSTRNASICQMFLNGSQFSNDRSALTIDPTKKLQTIGYRPGTNQTHQGLIGEIIIVSTFDVNLRQKIEGYLAHKWGLTANLPSDHPYKTVAP